MDWKEHPRIEARQGVRSGAPVIRGTRLPVATLVRYIADGFTVDELLGPDYFPHLAEEDVRAALRFAADLAEAPVLQAAE